MPNNTERKEGRATIKAEAEAWVEDNAWRFPPDYEMQTDAVKHAMAMAYRAGVRMERRRAAV